MRQSSTERIGVYKTASIVTENLGWIFREQPIVDVGIDALIEQVIDGNPTGKFIALQIKTGEGNFHLSDGKIIHYVTQIHYNYWLNLNIPILLIAHFPSEETTYWQHITERNFKRTKKQWKLEIPKNQKLNEKSISNLTAILPKEKETDILINIFEGKTTEEDVFEILEGIKSIGEATVAMFNIGNINEKINDHTNVLNGKLNTYIAQKLSDKDAPVISAFKAYSKQLSYSASRIERETEIFADYYSEGIFAFEAAIIFLLENKYDFNDLETDFKEIHNIPSIIDSTVKDFSTLRLTLEELPTSYPGMKEARTQYLEVINLLERELQAAKNLTERLIEKLP